MDFFKNLTQKRVKLLVRGCVSFVALLIVLLFAGCAEEDDAAGGHLNGVWTNNAGGYITIIKIDTLAKTVEYVNSYKGDIVNAPDFTAANGVLIIRFTEYWDADYSDYPDVKYTENTANINKYGALYWRNLTTNSVLMSDAGTSGGGVYTHTMFGSFLEAQANFTMDKAGVYVNWSITGPYTK